MFGVAVDLPEQLNLSAMVLVRWTVNINIWAELVILAES